MSIDERIEFLMQSIESHDRQIGELTGQIGELTGQIGELKDSIATLVRVTNEDGTAIRTLARVAEAHEARLGRLERNPEV